MHTKPIQQPRLLVLHAPEAELLATLHHLGDAADLHHALLETVVLLGLGIIIVLAILAAASAPASPPPPAPPAPTATPAFTPAFKATTSGLCAELASADAGRLVLMLQGSAREGLSEL